MALDTSELITVLKPRKENKIVTSLSGVAHNDLFVGAFRVDIHGLLNRRVKQLCLRWLFSLLLLVGCRFLRFRVLHEFSEVRLHVAWH